MKVTIASSAFMSQHIAILKSSFIHSANNLYVALKQSRLKNENQHSNITRLSALGVAWEIMSIYTIFRIHSCVSNETFSTYTLKCVMWINMLSEHIKHNSNYQCYKQQQQLKKDYLYDTIATIYVKIARYQFLVKSNKN